MDNSRLKKALKQMIQTASDFRTAEAACHPDLRDTAHRLDSAIEYARAALDAGQEMNRTHAALEWIANEAGNYADGAEDSHYLQKAMAEIEGRAKEALAAETPGGTGLFLRALCKQHKLTSASVNFNHSAHASFFYAYAHWNTDGVDHCTSGHGPDAETAMRLAIEDMKAKRAEAEQAA